METSAAITWSSIEARLTGLLRSSATPTFLPRIRDAVRQVMAIAPGHTDELIFLILRHDHSELSNATAANALHSAALCCVLARRLGWSDQAITSLVGAALTMNLSILDLQGMLASRGEAPTADERQILDAHPRESARLLKAAGLDDPEWLQIVEQHHEQAGGSGYPGKLQAPSEASQMLRMVDKFVAKHSPRNGRTPVSAHLAAKQLYTEANGDPMVQLLIKEVGIYPPGCYVRLANGELAVVTRVGAAANKPVVATFTTPDGAVLARPVRRDTAVAAYAVVSIVPETAVKVRLSVDKLYERI